MIDLIPVFLFFIIKCLLSKKISNRYFEYLKGREMPDNDVHKLRLKRQHASLHVATTHHQRRAELEALLPGNIIW